MADRTRRGLAIVSAALVFGLAADVLAREVPGRLDTALGAGVLVLLVAWLAHREPGLPMPASALGPAAGTLIVLLIWRDSPTLFALDLLALGVAGVMAVPRLRLVGAARAAISDWLVGGLQLAAGIAAGAAPLLLTEIDWRALPSGAATRRVRGPAVGLVAAIPVVGLFGGLLMDADPVFDRLMTETVTLPLDELAPHVVSILLWAWLAAGLLRVAFREAPARPPAAAVGGRFGFGEIATVLGLVDLLFLVFVAVQFRYLFGGTEVVQAVTGLSYAEYARSGFFQLVTVAALSLPLLLAADWALGRRDEASLRRFRLLALLMLLLLDVMLASALFRMWLYTVEYGLTELRFYTTAFMAWLVLVLGWFASTVLRGRRTRFAPGAVAAAGLVLIALHLLNPDALIARTNLSRASVGKPVDVQYASRLSADALPTLRRSLPGLPAAERRALAAALRDRWGPELAGRVRWNISLRRAALEIERRGWGMEGEGGLPR